MKTKRCDGGMDFPTVFFPCLTILYLIRKMNIFRYHYELFISISLEYDDELLIIS